MSDAGRSQDLVEAWSPTSAPLPRFLTADLHWAESRAEVTLSQGYTPEGASRGQDLVLFFGHAPLTRAFREGADKEADSHGVGFFIVQTSEWVRTVPEWIWREAPVHYRVSAELTTVEVASDFPPEVEWRDAPSREGEEG